MSTYSFKDFAAAIVGPGGAFNLGNGSGAAEEGVTIEPVGDKNVMLVGADGSGVNSLRADDSVTVTVRLLKTSPINAALMLMLNFQKLSSLNWGKNVITLRDVARGDTIVCTQAAFKRVPSLNYAVEAGTNEWTFDAITSTVILGTGSFQL